MPKQTNKENEVLRECQVRNLVSDALGYGNRKNKSFILAMQQRNFDMLRSLVRNACRIAVLTDKSTLSGLMAHEAILEGGRPITGGLSEKECNKIKEAREADIVRKARKIVKRRKQEAEENAPPPSKKKKGKTLAR